MADSSTISPPDEIVRAYLDAAMKPDPETASTYVAASCKITFTGGRVFEHPSGPAEFNAKRYKWVKKRLERFDVAEGPDGTVIYSLGTLFGEWPDGTPFEGNRYIDRFELENGKIAKMDVWNDSAERILVMRGIDA